MTLTAADLALYRRFAIDTALLERQQIRRVDDQEARDLLGLNGRHGDMHGILYPYLWPGESRPVTHRLRRDNPEYEDGRPKNKYLSPYGDRRHLYLACDRPACLTDVTITIIAVEAEKSVLAVTCAANRAGRDVLAIGLGGCWGWRGRIGKVLTPTGGYATEVGPLADFDRLTWPGREVVLVFDANAATNPKVRAARAGLAKECINRGARVRIAAIPEEPGVNGPDDYLAEHGDALFFALVDAARTVNETSQDTVLLPPPSHPMAVARAFIEASCTTADGLVLRDHRGDFYRWDGTCWPENDKLDVRRELYCYVEHANYLEMSTKGPTVKPFAPTVRKINDLVDALRACVGLPTAEEAPFWTTSTDEPPARELVTCQNGLLHLPTRMLLPSTPRFFSHHALPFAFDATAPAPAAWLTFLDALWGDDSDSIATLQEVMGYVLGGDTRQQKMFLLVGPKRAGKGTIGRVLTGLLGTHHVAAPTLASLSMNFGLQPLIGKPLALVSDARLSSKGDSKIVVERLLSVSGEDSLTIDRKYKDPWTGRLPTRFLILTNELPRLSDASGALASRFVLLVLTRSFYGVEDPGLTASLLANAPGILNWALEGLDRLTKRGYFVNPPSGQDAIQQLEDLSSPVAAFLRECCVLKAEAEVLVDELWSAWKLWCEQSNHPPGSRAMLGRDLRAAAPTVKKARPRSDDDDRHHVYQGLGFLGKYNGRSL